MYNNMCDYNTFEFSDQIYSVKKDLKKKLIDVSNGGKKNQECNPSILQVVYCEET